MCSAQGIDLLAPLKASEPLEAAKATIRKVVPKLEDDRTLTPDIEKIRDLMTAGEIVAAAETTIGPLLEA
ncbi:MAG: histidine ammonia-lyase, partial [Candidatus Thorarchaeota archaeon]|nr:histidine ammonia-lyase [Candidatus Thorarchaeota archaeon]